MDVYRWRPPPRLYAAIVIVTDASVLATALADDGADGDQARGRLSGHRLAAPELIDLEVLSVLHRHRRAGLLDDKRADLALADLRALPLKRVAHLPLVVRCWELRDTVTAYDAAYIALAELLECPLITADTTLASAPGIRCSVDVVR